MSDTSVVNLIMNRVVEFMVSEMEDAVPDATKVGLFRTGKLQSDPTIREFNLTLREGGDEWPDGILPRGYTITAPQSEMGGGTSYLRRFIVDYELFFLGEVDRNLARTNAMVIWSRFKYLIATCPMRGLKDSFGEVAILTQFNKHIAREGGGPGNFIWRGSDYFEVLTESEVG